MNMDRSITGSRHSRVAALLGLMTATLLVSTPGAAFAQEYESWRDSQYAEQDQNEPGFELTGYVGAFTPLASLADQGDSLKAEFSTKLAFSLGLDFWFPGGFGLGAFGGYSRPDLTILQIEEAGTFPTELNLGGTDYWYGVLTAMYRPNLSGNPSVLRPYFMLGGGVRSVGSAELPTVGEDRLRIESSTKPVLAFGIGAHLVLSNTLYLRLEVRDLMSEFDSEPFQEGKLQNDLLTSVGLGIALH